MPCLEGGTHDGAVVAVESNLEIKEENQMLREQDVIRNELLTRYEKRNEDMTKEVSAWVELRAKRASVCTVEILQRAKQ